MRRRPGNGAEDFKIELTSLVDIMFLLILFLVLTTTFTVSQSKFKVKLPSAVTSTSQVTQNKKILNIVVTADNSVYVDDTNIGIKGLMSFVTTYVDQYGTPTSVYLKADRDAKYGTIIKVMDVLRNRKIFNIDLIVRKLQ